MDYAGLFITFGLPPLLGAVIGYVTNALAIKMLFRPLKAYKIAGIPVPFTPGIIPRQRSSLARNIGTMVSTQLIAPETVINRLKDPESSLSLEAHLFQAMKSYARKPLRELFSFDTGDSGGDSSRLTESLDRVLELGLAVLLPRSPGEILGLSREEGTLPWDQPEGKEAFLAYLKGRIQVLGGQGVSLRSALGEETFTSLGAFLEDLYPSVVKGLFQWLDTPEVKKQLEASGLVLLEKTLSRLSGFQRFFVSAGQYDRTLADNMGGLVSDGLVQLRTFLETPVRRREIITAVVEALERLLDPQGTPALQEAASLEDRLVHLADRGWDLLHPMFSRWASEALYRPLEEWVTVLSGRDSRDFRLSLSASLAGVLNRSRLTREGDSQSGWWDASPAEILPLTDEDYRRACAYLSSRILDWGTGAVPGLLQTFDVRKVVEDRINSLDMLEVENLLLLVIRKHLGYINWIGALLGGLIGAVQIFF